MEAIKQHFIDMSELQECWYNNELAMIHYSHPAYPNHISRAEALQIKEAKVEKTSYKDKTEK